MPGVTRENIRAKLRRDLTDDEWETAETELIPQMQGVIEGYLNHAFGERTVVERLQPVHGIVYPGVLPLVSVTEATQPGGTEIVYTQLDDERVLVGISTPVTLTYVAGEPDMPPPVRGFIAGSIARTLLVPSIVSLSVMGSYSVEGTTITYSPSMTDGSSGNVVGYTVGELVALQHLRRLQIA